MKIEKLEEEGYLDLIQKIDELVDAVNQLQEQSDKRILRDIFGEDNRTVSDKIADLRYLESMGYITKEEMNNNIKSLQSTPEEFTSELTDNSLGVDKLTKLNDELQAANEKVREITAITTFDKMFTPKKDNEFTLEELCYIEDVLTFDKLVGIRHSLNDRILKKLSNLIKSKEGNKMKLKDQLKAMRYRTCDAVDLDADMNGDTIIKGMSWWESFKMFIRLLFK